MIEKNMPPPQEAEKRKSQEADKPDPGDSLDAALADSFPASDPPARVVKGTTSNPRPEEKRGGQCGHPVRHA